jgi:hypothetical protein
VVENQYQINSNREQDTWSLYLYALKSPMTRQKYQKRLEKFFDFLGIEGSTVEDKSKKFFQRIQVEENDNNNKQWVFNSLIKTYGQRCCNPSFSSPQFCSCQSSQGVYSC